MGSSGAITILLFCVAFSMASTAFAGSNNSTFIAANVLDRSTEIGAASPARSRKLISKLAQHNNHCPVLFAQLRKQRYSRVTSSCKGGERMGRCCAALKAFACPYADLLNDLSNGCADDMFYEILTRGRLPSGIFSNNCKEGPAGLECPAA